MTTTPKNPTDYIVHRSYYPEDGTAYFGPVPVGERDPLNTDAADFWAQTGNIDLIYKSRIPDDAYINPWSVWLDPDSDIDTEVRNDD